MVMMVVAATTVVVGVAATRDHDGETIRTEDEPCGMVVGVAMTTGTVVAVTTRAVVMMVSTVEEDTSAIGLTIEGIATRPGVVKQTSFAWTVLLAY